MLFVSYSLPAIKRMELSNQNEVAKSNATPDQSGLSDLLSYLRLALKLYAATIPILIGWVAITIFVGLSNDKAQLAACSIIVNLVETTAILIFCLGFQQKMTIGYFVAKRDLKLVKKLIRWAFYTFHINSGIQVIVCVGGVLLISFFGKGKESAVSGYLLWSIPYLAAMVYADGFVMILNALMKCFNYIWYASFLSFFSNFTLVVASYYLAVAKKMGFKGAMIASLSYLFVFLPLHLAWLIFTLDVDNDIHQVDFDEDEMDEE